MGINQSHSIPYIYPSKIKKMTPIELIEFVNKGGHPSVFGTRDQDLQPLIGRAVGAKIIENGSELIVYAQNILGQHQKNLENNAWISYTVCELLTHITYQFKGSFLSIRKVESVEELKWAKENKLLFRDNFLTAGVQHLASLVEKVNTSNLTAITFKIESIFNQTPGPKAGTQISNLETINQ